MTFSTCYLNGRYLPVAEACVPATDRGLLFGEGLFESWRTYHRRPFAVREHVERLAKSARVLGIPFDASADWEARSRTLLRRNGVASENVVIRLTITRGGGPVSLIPQEVVRPTELMLVRGIDPGIGRARAEGVAVHLFDCGGGVDPGLRAIKTVNYVPAVLGKIAAAEHGCFESIYRLPDRTLLEGTTTNLFIVKKGTLCTEPVGAGVLPGVTRALVMKLAARVVEVRERRITSDDLRTADEAFLTASSIEIVPIVASGRRRAAGGKPGPLTRELQRRYRMHVAKRLDLAFDDLGD
jgi:branched-subunit amino acid aminotransferase/4-amino-4-deoxychorismate lyase